MDLLLSNVNIGIHLWIVLGFPGGLDDKESTCNAGTKGDADSIPRARRSSGARQPTPVFLPGESHGQRRLVATVQVVVKNQTRLSNYHFHFLFGLFYEVLSAMSNINCISSIYSNFRYISLWGLIVGPLGINSLIDIKRTVDTWTTWKVNLSIMGSWSSIFWVPLHPWVQPKM